MPYPNDLNCRHKNDTVVSKEELIIIREIKENNFKKIILLLSLDDIKKFSWIILELLDLNIKIEYIPCTTKNEAREIKLSEAQSVIPIVHKEINKI